MSRFALIAIGAWAGGMLIAVTLLALEGSAKPGAALFWVAVGVIAGGVAATVASERRG